MKQVRTPYNKGFKIKPVELSHQQVNIQAVADQLKVYLESLRL
jgi:hypothetical protein